MTVGLRLRARGLFLVLGVATACSCRDTDPPRPHNRDLGNDETILLPLSSPRKDPDLKDGEAEWHSFREVLPGEAADTADGGGELPAEEIEAEIRDVIDAYNELVAEGDVEELLKFFVEDQGEVIAPYLEVGLAVSKKLAETRAALEERLPGAGERIAGAFDAFDSTLDLRLAVQSVNIVSETEATGRLPSGRVAPACRFVFADEDWYIELLELPDLSQVKPTVDVLSGMCDGWLQAIQSGAETAESILAQVEQQAQAIRAARPEPGEGRGDSEGGG